MSQTKYPSPTCNFGKLYWLYYDFEQTELLIKRIQQIYLWLHNRKYEIAKITHDTDQVLQELKSLIDIIFKDTGKHQCSCLTKKFKSCEYEILVKEWEIILR